MATRKQSDAVRPFWRHPTFAWIVGFVMGVGGAAFTYIMNASLVVAFPFAALSIAVNTVLMAALVFLFVGGVLHALQWAYDRYNTANPTVSDVILDKEQKNINQDVPVETEEVKIQTQIVLVSYTNDKDNGEMCAKSWEAARDNNTLGDDMHVIVPRRLDGESDGEFSEEVRRGLRRATDKVVNNSNVQLNTIFCGTGMEYWKTFFSSMKSEAYSPQGQGCQVRKRCIFFEVDFQGEATQEDRERQLDQLFRENADTDFVFTMSQITMKQALSDDPEKRVQNLWHTYLSVASLISKKTYSNVARVFISGQATHENYWKPKAKPKAKAKAKAKAIENQEGPVINEHINQEGPVINEHIINNLVKVELNKMCAEIEVNFDHTGSTIKCKSHSVLSNEWSNIINTEICKRNTVGSDQIEQQPVTETQSLQQQNQHSQQTGKPQVCTSTTSMKVKKDQPQKEEQRQHRPQKVSIIPRDLLRGTTTVTTVKKNITLVSHGSSIKGAPWRQASEEKKLGDTDVIAPDWNNTIKKTRFEHLIKEGLAQAMSGFTRTENKEVQFNIVCCSAGGANFPYLKEQVLECAKKFRSVRVRIISCEAFLDPGYYTRQRDIQRELENFLSEWDSDKVKVEMVLAMSESTFSKKGCRYNNPYKIYCAAQKMHNKAIKCVKITGAASHANYLVPWHDRNNRKTVLNTAMMSHLLHAPLEGICNEIKVPHAKTQEQLHNPSQICTFYEKEQMSGKIISKQSTRVNSNQLFPLDQVSTTTLPKQGNSGVQLPIKPRSSDYTG